MKKLEEILALPAEEAVKELQKRNGSVPNVDKLLKSWNPELHDVMNKEIRKPKKILLEEEERDHEGKIIKPARYEYEEVNRIYLPIEQDQVGIHTAFTVGTEPALTCEDQDEKDREVFTIIKGIHKKNKLKFQNKDVVRSYLAETEVCEYWFTQEDPLFWTRMSKKVGKKLNATRVLKSVLWSPLKGDTLYPIFDDYNRLIVMSRGYKVNIDGQDYERFMSITNREVVVWQNDSGWKEINRFEHQFKKLPCIYARRKSGPLCKNIEPVRNRLEKLYSDYADCIDYNFFPKLALEGEMTGRPSKNNGDVIQLENGAKIAYLTWNQTPESAKMEFENLMEQAYSLTKTPRISFENLKGIGLQSGVAFKFCFMGIHSEVSNHAEDIEPFLQRRYNFLVSAIGSVCTEYDNAETEIDVEIVPFMIDSLKERVETAVSAKQGGVMSTDEAVVFVGVVDNAMDEVEKIKEDSKVSENKPSNDRG